IDCSIFGRLEKKDINSLLKHMTDSVIDASFDFDTKANELSSKVEDIATLDGEEKNVLIGKIKGILTVDTYDLVRDLVDFRATLSGEIPDVDSEEGQSIKRSFLEIVK